MVKRQQLHQHTIRIALSSPFITSCASSNSRVVFRLHSQHRLGYASKTCSSIDVQVLCLAEGQPPLMTACSAGTLVELWNAVLAATTSAAATVVQRESVSRLTSAYDVSNFSRTTRTKAHFDCRRLLCVAPFAKGSVSAKSNGVKPRRVKHHNRKATAGEELDTKFHRNFSFAHSFVSQSPVRPTCLHALGSHLKKATAFCGGRTDVLNLWIEGTAE